MGEEESTAQDKEQDKDIRQIIHDAQTVHKCP
jgi:hypothetical protein